MDLRISRCFLVVHDVDAALAFYRDAPGLEVRNDVMVDTMRWLTLSSPAQPDVEVMLDLPSNVHSVAGRSATAQLPARALLKGLIFATGSCDDTFEQVRVSGAEVLQEPINRPYGVRDCAFRDPSGNMIRFAEPRR
jgi:catechol 2,3-dioxygenase-like lactoylglutathione lyase family enzyme